MGPGERRANGWVGKFVAGRVVLGCREEVKPFWFNDYVVHRVAENAVQLFRSVLCGLGYVIDTRKVDGTGMGSREIPFSIAYSLELDKAIWL